MILTTNKLSWRPMKKPRPNHWPRTTSSNWCIREARRWQSSSCSIKPCLEINPSAICVIIQRSSRLRWRRYLIITNSQKLTDLCRIMNSELKPSTSKAAWHQFSSGQIETRSCQRYRRSYARSRKSSLSRSILENLKSHALQKSWTSMQRWFLPSANKGN